MKISELFKTREGNRAVSESFDESKARILTAARLEFGGRGRSDEDALVMAIRRIEEEAGYVEDALRGRQVAVAMVRNLEDRIKALDGLAKAS